MRSTRAILARSVAFGARRDLVAVDVVVPEPDPVAYRRCSRRRRTDRSRATARCTSMCCVVVGESEIPLPVARLIQLVAHLLHDPHRRADADVLADRPARDRIVRTRAGS